MLTSLALYLALGVIVGLIAGLLGVGGGIGFVSSLVGIGGGSLTVPFLTWCNQQFPEYSWATFICRPSWASS